MGFDYASNATGRLVGTLLSGVFYLWGDLELALWGSTAFVVATWLLTLRLPPPINCAAQSAADAPVPA